MNWLTLILDFALIGLLATGIAYAVKLTRQLAAMRASRSEMERFVLEFSATVSRAENGIKGLKTAARSSGDDLEKLIDKAHSLRDELHFLVESADQMANRLSATATHATRAMAAPTNNDLKQKEESKASPVSVSAPPQKKGVGPTGTTSSSSPPPSAISAAEKELMLLLKKIG